MTLESTLAKLAFERPFLGHIASALRRGTFHSTTTTPRWPIELTVTNAGSYHLAVDPVQFAALDERARMVMVEHELLHLVFRHPERAFGDRALFAMAADLVVNQYLSLGKPLDGMRTIAAYRLPEGLDVGGYYALLEKKGCDSSCSGFCDQNPWASNACAACAKGPAAKHSLDEILYRAFVRLGHTESESSGRKRAGVLPGSTFSALRALVKRLEGGLNWRVLLRRFATSARSSQIKNTMRRPSKRYGTFPGTKLKRRQRAAVVVDTSGSISERELSAFFGEIDRLHCAGAEIELMEADAAVQRRYPYRGQWPDDVKGRGGTCFDPALGEVRRDRARFDFCVYLTDGVAPAPTVAPGCSLLWLVVGNGSTQHLRFGKSVRLLEV